MLVTVDFIIEVTNCTNGLGVMNNFTVEVLVVQGGADVVFVTEQVHGLAEQVQGLAL